MNARAPDHLLVFGASGHGKVVADAAIASGLSVKGFLDDDASRHGASVLGLPVVGGFDALGRESDGVAVALGVGANAARAALLARMKAAGRAVATVVHPSAIVGSGAVIGEGSFLAPRSVVHTDARVGRGCIVNTGAIVEHDCVLGECVHVSPGAALGGHVSLGDEVHVGLGAVVLPGCSVGARSVVGAGAVVAANVGAGVTVVGVPARVRP